MHSLLNRQLKRFFGGVSRAPAGVGSFIAAVDEAYRSFDDDRRMLERSLELSSGELLRANSDMRAVFQALPDLFLRLDSTGLIRDFKGPAHEFGLLANPLIGRHIQELLSAEVAVQFGRTLERVRQTRSLARIEYTLRLGQQDSVFEARLVPLFADEVIAIVRNITERAQAEVALTAQRSFLRQVIDLNPSFVFAKDRRGQFTLANKAVAEAYGTTVEELLGKTDSDFNAHPEEVEQFRRDDLEVMETGKEKLILEESITDATGRVRYLQTIKRPIIQADGTADQVLGIAVDITERKRLEEQLLQSQKMEAIGLLAGGVAHDFNNLLNVISGYAELAMEGLPEEDATRDLLDRVTGAAMRAADLTRKLLAFSRRQILQVHVFDLNDVLDEFSKMLSRIVGEDIEVAILKSAQPLPVKADAGQLDQVLLNLCTNARQAMPHGGRITIDTSAMTLDDEFAMAHPWSRPGDYARLDVSDTGIGMDSRTLERIFEPFFTTKDEGTGLGLAMVYGIVKQHGGFVNVYSEPNVGTTFRLYFPLLREPQRLEEAPVERTGAIGGGETILIAEDEEMLRDLLSICLSRFGYHVITAKGGEEAVEIFSARRGEIDLVVLDTVMPRMSGPEAYRRMKELNPKMRVMFISGYAPDAARLAELIEAEKLPFVSKPFSPRTLAELIRELLVQPIPIGRD